MNYIIVNSVKGGCGKSSVSLRTAIELAEEKEGDKYVNKVLIIDMDILGSSLRTFVTGELLGSNKTSDNTDNTITFPPTTSSTHVSTAERWLCPYTSKISTISEKFCFTDLFYKKYNEVKDKPIEMPFCVCSKTSSGNDPVLYIAFSSEDQNVKNRFRTQKSNNYALSVNVRYYEEILRKYLKYLPAKSVLNYGSDGSCLENMKPYNFTHIIFDMPPNSDPYSECVYSILLKMLKEDGEKNSVELRLVSSCDLAHINANLSWVENMLKKNGWNYTFPSKLVFVINDITGAAEIENNDQIKHAIIKKIGESVHDACFDRYKDEQNKDPEIYWIKRDTTLIHSSARQVCVSFTIKDITTREYVSKISGSESALPLEG